ncbi:MAG: tetratricopeptide repeat protein, partial [Prevotella sp.]|nr:tetratricopeptide repeat protein [Prevotella sp.]
IAIDPDDAESLFQKGNVFRLLKNYEQAIESYRRGIKLDPNICSSYLLLADCLEELERHDEALETLERALKQTEGSTSQKYVYEHLASIHSTLKQPQKALACLDMAATLDGNDNPISLMIQRGDILLANDRFDEAVQTFKQAIIQSDYDTETIMDVGVTLYENHYVEAARDLFGKLIAISDGNEDKDLSGEYCYMALCYRELLQYDEFLEYLQKAVETNPAVAKIVLSHLFPGDMQPEDYYQYMYNQIKNETK